MPEKRKAEASPEEEPQAKKTPPPTPIGGGAAVVASAAAAAAAAAVAAGASKSGTVKQQLQQRRKMEKDVMKDWMQKDPEKATIYDKDFMKYVMSNYISDVHEEEEKAAEVIDSDSDGDGDVVFQSFDLPSYDNILDPEEEEEPEPEAKKSSSGGALDGNDMGLKITNVTSIDASAFAKSTGAGQTRTRTKASIQASNASAVSRAQGLAGGQLRPIVPAGMPPGTIPASALQGAAIGLPPGSIPASAFLQNLKSTAAAAATRAMSQIMAQSAAAGGAGGGVQATGQPARMFNPIAGTGAQSAQRFVVPAQGRRSQGAFRPPVTMGMAMGRGMPIRPVRGGRLGGSLPRTSLVSSIAQSVAHQQLLPQQQQQQRMMQPGAQRARRGQPASPYARSTVRTLLDQRPPHAMAAAAAYQSPTAYQTQQLRLQGRQQAARGARQPQRGGSPAGRAVAMAPKQTSRLEAAGAATSRRPYSKILEPILARVKTSRQRGHNGRMVTLRQMYDVLRQKFSTKQVYEMCLWDLEHPDASLMEIAMLNAFSL